MKVSIRREEGRKEVAENNEEEGNEDDEEEGNEVEEKEDEESEDEENEDEGESSRTLRDFIEERSEEISNENRVEMVKLCAPSNLHMCESNLHMCAVKFGGKPKKMGSNSQGLSSLIGSSIIRTHTLDN
ncbi:predicted protein [Arabidopsis lyrata subsp. lyrata]|uniref:Predicted protein n=1 Tax=Arabidopsis lyrata subsp. lyrata TaxID=81972 RepID=D7LX66_ARALL|nr:predicted protein [Arabidopsis lyrata subsp. lyrata]